MKVGPFTLLAVLAVAVATLARASIDDQQAADPHDPHHHGGIHEDSTTTREDVLKTSGNFMPFKGVEDRLRFKRDVWARELARQKDAIRRSLRRDKLAKMLELELAKQGVFLDDDLDSTDGERAPTCLGPDRDMGMSGPMVERDWSPMGTMYPRKQSRMSSRQAMMQPDPAVCKDVDQVATSCQNNPAFNPAMVDAAETKQYQDLCALLKGMIDLNAGGSCTNMQLDPQADAFCTMLVRPLGNTVLQGMDACTDPAKATRPSWDEMCKVVTEQAGADLVAACKAQPPPGGGGAPGQQPPVAGGGGGAPGQPPVAGGGAGAMMPSGAAAAMMPSGAAGGPMMQASGANAAAGPSGSSGMPAAGSDAAGGRSGANVQCGLLGDLEHVEPIMMKLILGT